MKFFFLLLLNMQLLADFYIFRVFFYLFIHFMSNAGERKIISLLEFFSRAICIENIGKL